MLRTTLIALFAACIALPVRAQFTDGFDDGDFTNDPTWSGDAGLFTIVQEAGSNMLRSNSPGAATYHLSTPSLQAANAQWEFFLNLKFATSGTNYVDVYLMSPQADLIPRPEGYFVRIGDTPDHIVLYRRVGTTNTALAESPNGTVGSSSNNPFRIRVTRDADDLWTLAYQPGGTGNFTLAGTATDATFNSCTHFGVLIVQSAAAGPINNHFFDDFIVGNIPVDGTPPTIVGVDVVDATQVDVRFDEPVTLPSANIAANYALAPAIAINSAQQDGVDPTKVRLVLAQAMQNGTTYTLTVNGVEDAAGNATVGATGQFLYFVPDVPAYREVVINELMPDPNPPVGLPDAEYIELFNATTDKYFDLAGWRITTLSTSATLPAHPLGPGDHVVFVNNAQLPNFSAFPNVRGYSLSNTALLNAGTTVTLEAPGNVAIDVVAYTSDWYQDPDKVNGGWSLEQVDPYAPCSGAQNWRASVASLGGTPGSPNSVLQTTPDDTPPALVQAQVLSANALQLVFSEGLDGASIPGATYTITPFVPVTSVLPQPPINQLVQVLLGAPLEEGVMHTITVTGVADCSGNTIATANSAQFLFFTPAAPAFRDVVINELMVDPTPTVGLPDAEYIELFNTTTDKFFDLAGWRITTLTTSATLPSYALLPGEHVVFVNNAQVPNFSAIPNVAGYGLSTTALLNDGTTLTLEGPGGAPVDVVAYTSAWYRDPAKSDGGWSLEQIDPYLPCSGAFNWRASTGIAGGTPGEANAVLQVAPDTAPPVLEKILPLSETLLELVFNEGLGGESVLDATYTITPFLPVNGIISLPPINQRVQLILGAAMEIGTIYTLVVEGVDDCSGNAITGANSAQFALPEAPEAGDVVVNEVLPNPITTGGEYVEVYNRSTKVLSLQGWKMANESGGAVANPRVISNEPLLLFPGEYMLFTRNPFVTAQQFPLGRSGRFVTVNLPSYTNTSGVVVVLSDQDDVIDLFRYDDKLHFPLLRNVKGVSLERQDPDRPTDDRTNWHSASEYVGFGTPGYENSQYAPAPRPTGEMTIEPAIFSPDNDGYQDVLTIAFRFDQPGFVGTMRVYDIAGREVRRLMDSQLLGTLGAVSWDGIQDNGSKARMGPYIVHFEVYDLAGNVETFRKTVTLAHRLD
ncbi:MAG: lamin tail domain-containing protein [Flavobacteriales bacterium]|nr:lamin tail domain-containing protein [Flavobacteriales bacterium]